MKNREEMSVIVAMTDRKLEELRKSVRHRGYDGQKGMKNREEMSVIVAMMDRKLEEMRKSVRH